MQYEVVKKSSRVFVTVEDGICTRAESPTHGCFGANFLGEPWDEVRARLEADGFTVHQGN